MNYNSYQFSKDPALYPFRF